MFRTSLGPPDAVDTELLEHIAILRKEKRAGLSFGNKIVLDNGIATESRCSLKLIDYKSAAYPLCTEYHKPGCLKCVDLGTICSIVLSERIVKLSSLWREISTNPYNWHHAERLVMQVPVVTLRTDTVGDGLGEIYVASKSCKDSYNSLVNALKMLPAVSEEQSDCTLLLKNCIGITTTTKEKELLKHVAASVMNASRREASKLLGVSFGHNGSRCEKVNEAVAKVEKLKEDNLKKMKAELIEKVGVSFISEEEESEASLSSDGESDFEEELSAFCKEDVLVSEEGAENVVIKKRNAEIDEMGESEKDGEDQDYLPPISVRASYTVYESDVEVKNINNDKNKLYKRIVDKYNARTRNDVEKMQLLQRKGGEQSREISVRHPEIGQVMEAYARLCDVGADQWRRTGVLTFR